MASINWWVQNSSSRIRSHRQCRATPDYGDIFTFALNLTPGFMTQDTNVYTRVPEGKLKVVSVE